MEVYPEVEYKNFDASTGATFVVELKVRFEHMPKVYMDLKKVAICTTYFQNLRKVGVGSFLRPTAYYVHYQKLYSGKCEKVVLCRDGQV